MTNIWLTLSYICISCNLIFYLVIYQEYAVSFFMYLYNYFYQAKTGTSWSQKKHSLIIRRYTAANIVKYKSWLFTLFVDCVVREVRWVLGKRLELLRANGGWFEINQLFFFADYTVLVAEFQIRSCVDRYVMLVEFTKTDRWDWMWVRVKLWGERSMEIYRSNACETQRRTVRGYGLCYVRGFASGRGWRM